MADFVVAVSMTLLPGDDAEHIDGELEEHIARASYEIENFEVDGGSELYSRP